MFFILKKILRLTHPFHHTWGKKSLHAKDDLTNNHYKIKMEKGCGDGELYLLHSLTRTSISFLSTEAESPDGSEHL